MSGSLPRLIAAFLLVTGAAVWAFSTWAAAGVLAAEWEKMWGDPRHNESIGLGHGELGTALFDAQVGALLVLGCAVAVLLSGKVRGPQDVIATLITLPCVLLVVNAILVRVVGSSLTAATIGGLVLVVVCTAFLRTADSWFLRTPQRSHESPAGRVLLLGLSLSAAGALVALEGPEIAGWIVEALPGLVSISVVQGALVLAMLGLISVMTVRCTVVVVAAAAVIVALGGWMVLAPVSTRSGGTWILLALGAVLVMAAAAAAGSGSEDSRLRAGTRLLAVIAAAVAFCVALFPAFAFGWSVSMATLTFAGGDIGADGMPLLIGGVLAGLAGLAGYAAVLRWPNQPVADEPPASPTGDLMRQPG